MIAYFDTSALVKLVVVEPGSELPTQVFGAARLSATHLIAYAEAHAAISRLERTKAVSTPTGQLVRDQLERRWATMWIVGVDEELVRDAAALTRTFPLKGYDSVHLAAARRFHALAGNVPVMFACFDNGLNRAAARLGMKTLEQA